ncbi:hypothetical protein N44_00194 [Microcystis aeruginosa NIES-44]|uniref:Uncharacterized protein n=1 Tax=Microcystis aeruginosa NIES-44 TaxID=449439 RepID=A0A0A1VRJ9_MICAE|nr:hypothetical protein N44_00194 [Microcystis aeruginosa NIES-44]
MLIFFKKYNSCKNPTSTIGLEVSYQLSVISYQLSVISYQLSVH